MKDLPKAIVPLSGLDHCVDTFLLHGLEDVGYPVEGVSYKEFYESYNPRDNRIYICIEDGRNQGRMPDVEKLPFGLLKRNTVWYVTSQKFVDRIVRSRRLLGWVFASTMGLFRGMFDNGTLCSLLPYAASSFEIREKDNDVCSTADVESIPFLRSRWVFGKDWHRQMLNDFDRSRVGVVTTENEISIYEMLACGTCVLITSKIWGEAIFGYPLPSFVGEFIDGQLTMSDVENLIVTAEHTNAHNEAQLWAQEFGTYRLRAQMMLASLVDKKLLPERALHLGEKK